MKKIAFAAFALVQVAAAQADTLILPAQGIRHEGILLSLDVQGSQGMVRFTSVETFPYSTGPSFGQRGAVGVSVVINVDTGSELYNGCVLSSLTYMEPGSASLTVGCP